jgi:3-deoxy-manno-octulosonate cytidylyltransferase (CMP-KDO synthetase)
MKILGIIPARYASSRFMGKPLVEIGGKTMIQRVYEQALKAKCLSKVIVATDDERIFNHVKSFGGEVMMTAEGHPSGTDRCAEVVLKMNIDELFEGMNPRKTIVFEGIKAKRKKTTYDIVVNIQGDEPFIDPSQIDKVVEILSNSEKGDFSISTLVKKIDNEELIHNPNVVKCVFSAKNKALYFSRSPIPYLRNTPPSNWLSTGEFYKHLGLYAYKTSVLLGITKLPPSRLEQLESLEQLRWLENGYEIGVAVTDIETIGIDTPEDLLKIKNNEK